MDALAEDICAYYKRRILGIAFDVDRETFT